MIIAYWPCLDQRSTPVTEGAKPCKYRINYKWSIKENFSLSNGSERKSWYALYTKPRWEKKVHDFLQKKGLESYCPLNKVRKKWSDRFKIIEEPLFKSYVFVKVTEEDKTSVRFVDGVVNFVYWLGKPAVVQQEDIDRIKRFLNEYADVQVELLEQPKAGDKVIITSGVFMELEGTVLSTDKKRVEIRIENLGCKLVALVDKDKVALKS